MAKKDDQAKDQAEKQVPVIMALAGIVDWEIGPTKDSPCALTAKIRVEGYEDVHTIRALATGGVVVRVMPLQARLPMDAPVGCDHPEGVMIAFTSSDRVCLQCGCIVPIPEDDKPATEDPKA